MKSYRLTAWLLAAIMLLTAGGTALAAGKEKASMKFSATAECGCTKPVFPKQPIAPGKNGVIKVTYNPIGRPGAFDKVVTIKTNGKPGKVRLKIRGTVMPK